METRVSLKYFVNDCRKGRLNTHFQIRFDILPLSIYSLHYYSIYSKISFFTYIQKYIYFEFFFQYSINQGKIQTLQKFP